MAGDGQVTDVTVKHIGWDEDEKDHADGHAPNNILRDFAISRASCIALQANIQGRVDFFQFNSVAICGSNIQVWFDCILFDVGIVNNNNINVVLTIFVNQSNVL
jgi:hypothetical protein